MKRWKAATMAAHQKTGTQVPTPNLTSSLVAEALQRTPLTLHPVDQGQLGMASGGRPAIKDLTDRDLGNLTPGSSPSLTLGLGGLKKPVHKVKIQDQALKEDLQPVLENEIPQYAREKRRQLGVSVKLLCRRNPNPNFMAIGPKRTASQEAKQEAQEEAKGRALGKAKAETTLKV